MKSFRFLFIAIVFFFAQSALGQANGAYPWLEHPVTDAIASRFNPPEGFVRTAETSGNFGDWLRYLPLISGRPKVLLYDGREKGNQEAHEAVVDMDVGNRDLQQCADAVMRLRAEYLRQAGKANRISFRFTNGTPARWTDWARGMRPEVKGNKVAWKQKASPSSSYASFRSYLTKVFQYAGSASLSRELKPVPSTEPVQAGDVFIQGGFPGHAVIVVDTAENKSGERLFLLAQSYMPAQQVHILKNPNDANLSPWYRYLPGPLRTPEWRFPDNSLKRFGGR